MTSQGDAVNHDVAFTCRYTAGLRHVEMTKVANPIITDHIAQHLAGPKALKLAEDELSNLEQSAQGPGKHLRVPARTRIIDDKLIKALADLQHAKGHTGAVNVVSLGSGMDTRPWRLQGLEAVHWFDVDFPVTIQVKTSLLQQCGAGLGKNSISSGSSSAQPVQFPLLADSYAGVALDLSQQGVLLEYLTAAGFDKSLPTIFIAEAVLYYMPLTAATELLQEMAEATELSQHGVLIATCIDTELLEASRKMEGGTHVFAQLWHFDLGELSAHPTFRARCVPLDTPCSTRQLAVDLYKAETYVALYGGAELVFTVGLKQQACKA